MSNPSTADTPELPLSPDLLQRWQEELQWFFTATRGRLMELQSAPHAASSPPTCCDPPRPLQHDAGSSAAPHTSAVSPSAIYESTPHASSAHEDGQGAAPPFADEPPDRLQELKRRLAAQLARQ